MAVADTARGLREQGIDVTLFAVAHDPVPPELTGGPGAVARLGPLPRVLRTPRGSDALFLGTRLALSRRWAAALEEYPVDIVHSFSPGCLTLLPRRQAAVTQAWFHPPALSGSPPDDAPVRATVAADACRLHGDGASGSLSDALGYPSRRDLVLANTPTAEAGFRERGMSAPCVPPAIWFPEEIPEREPSDVLRAVFCGHPRTNRRKGSPTCSTRCRSCRAARWKSR